MQDENKKEPKKGHVYVAAFESIPDLCKIGCSEDANVRLLKTGRTFVPGDVRYRYVEVEDMYGEESLMQDVFDKYHHEKEWYKGCQDIAWKAIVLMAKGGHYYEYSPEEEESGGTPSEKAVKMQNWTLPRLCRAAEIPDDAIFVLDSDPNTTVKRLEGSRVECQGEPMSLSRAAKNIKGLEVQPPPFHHWRYEGKLLEEIKQDLIKKGVKP